MEGVKFVSDIPWHCDGPPSDPTILQAKSFSADGKGRNKKISDKKNLHKAVDQEQVEWPEAMDDVRCANSATRLNRQLLPTGADSVRRHRLEP